LFLEDDIVFLVTRWLGTKPYLY